MRRIVMALLLSGGIATCFRVTEAQAPGTETFVCGDANGDAKIDISDPIGLLSFLFLGGEPPECSIDLDEKKDLGTCESVARKTLEAGRHHALSEYWLAIARCDTLNDLDAAEECEAEARADFQANIELAGERHEARLALCKLLAEVRYDPIIDPADFLSPEESAASPNRFFPLVPGTTMRYRAETEQGTELNEVRVTDETREILGVTCSVIIDTVCVGGEVVEDTRDWYAQDREGNVWYFGELTVEYEGGEIAGIQGSWEAGVDGAKPGLIMKAQPAVGDGYRQEFSIGKVEDAAQVLALNESVVVPFGSFDGCLMTGELTPIEPGTFDHKFYAPGLGLVLEVKPRTGQRLELIGVETR